MECKFRGFVNKRVYAKKEYFKKLCKIMLCLTGIANMVEISKGSCLRNQLQK